jgi:excinuclease UvrABC helicase subunit UvrB
LEDAMYEHAKNLEFEAAAQVRDALKQLDAL